MTVTITFVALSGRVVFCGRSSDGSGVDVEVPLEVAHGWKRALDAAIGNAEAPPRSFDRFMESLW